MRHNVEPTGAPGTAGDYGAALPARSSGAPSYVASLPEETSVLVLLHDGQKLFDSCDFRCGSVAVPLLIGALPVHPPHTLSSDKGRFGEGTLTRYLRPIPLRTNLEQLNALTGDTEPEVELGANMWGRPALLDERADCLFDSLPFNVVQRHVLAS